RLDVGRRSHHVAQGRGVGRAVPGADGRPPRPADPRPRGGGQPHRLHPRVLRRPVARSLVVRAVPRATGDRRRLHGGARRPPARPRALGGHPREVRRADRVRAAAVAARYASAIAPPSTTMWAPVMNEASSEARNRAQRAMSSGSPTRPSGIPRPSFASRATRSTISAVSRARVVPGPKALARGRSRPEERALRGGGEGTGALGGPARS